MAEVLPAPVSHAESTSPYLSSENISPTSTIVLQPTVRGPVCYQDSDLEASSAASSAPSSPQLDKSSITSTPPSCVSFDPQDNDDEEPFFPTYDDRHGTPANLRSTCELPPSPAPTEDDMTSISPPTPADQDSHGVSSLYKPADDTAVHDEPSRQVDYLSHDWHEEDIWQSWRHIVSNRKRFGERSRLENASWRTWMKSKYHLRTLSPERLNWSKDCDVTWLYGPLQEGRHHEGDHRSRGIMSTSQSSAQLSKNNSFLKKPILKKRSVSEVMLQKSLSSSSLVKQAAAAVQAQRSSLRRASPRRPAMSRSQSHGAGLTNSSSSTVGPTSMLPSSSLSEVHTPDNEVRRRIRFDDTVEQCIAVDFKEGEPDSSLLSLRDVDMSSSEDEVIMMKSRLGRPASGQHSRRDSIGQESKGIVMLPSTTLKYHHDEPYCPGHPDQMASAAHHGPRLQHSTSQETIRPRRPAAESSTVDDDDDDPWEPSGAFDTPRPGSAAAHRNFEDEDSSDEAPAGLRRTASGMFMPLDNDEEPPYASNGVLGRVVDTVNTARDIFSVIVNVGWRS